VNHPDGTPIPPLPDLRFVALDAAALGLEGPRMSYMEAGVGTGATVLCLHGIGANSMGWRFSLAALSRHARVIAWNAPGYMLSDNLAAEAPGPERYADVAVALLDALGLTGPVFVAGSSFGSMLGACLAARHPGRVAKLALIGTSRGQRWKGPEGRAQMLAMRAASVAEGGVALAMSDTSTGRPSSSWRAARCMASRCFAAPSRSLGACSALAAAWSDRFTARAAASVSGSTGTGRAPRRAAAMPAAPNAPARLRAIKVKVLRAEVMPTPVQTTPKPAGMPTELP
jgi:pimeloyl-ACP methyl ester carboxylesterase